MLDERIAREKIEHEAKAKADEVARERAERTREGEPEIESRKREEKVYILKNNQ